MASVYKRPNTKYWFAGWYDAQGKFHLRSTKQIDRQKALSVALEYERAEKLARRGLLTEIAARKVLNDILERTGAAERLRMPSAREWLDGWLLQKEQDNSQDTADRYRSVVEAFLTSLGDRADRPLAVITAQQVQDYINGCRKAGNTTKTACLNLATLRAAFNSARRKGLIDVNPAEAVELKEKEDEAVEREVFTPAEVAMLVQAAEGEWKSLILLAYYTGARLGKCASLKWAAVDFSNETIVFRRPGKRGKGVVVPMHPELRENLESLAGRDTPEESVLPTLSGREAGGKRGLSRAFKAIARDAGVDMRETKTANGRMFCRRSFHSLRHSFTSALANAEVPPELRRKLTGHKSASSHDIYTHIEISTLKDAIAKLPKLPTL